MAEGLLSRRAGSQMLGDKPASLALSGGPVTPRLKGQGRWPDMSVTSWWLGPPHPSEGRTCTHNAIAEQPNESECRFSEQFVFILSLCLLEQIP